MLWKKNSVMSSHRTNMLSAFMHIKMNRKSREKTGNMKYKVELIKDSSSLRSGQRKWDQQSSSKLQGHVLRVGSEIRVMTDT